MKFLVIRKKTIIIFILMVVLLCCFAFLPSIITSSPNKTYTIVIDAGHGGVDAGCEGTLEGSNERELNLKYSYTLKSYFENYGLNVIMTRTTTDGLYSAYATNRKKDDMEKRRQIIESSNADIIISIHMNSYPLSSVRGAQAFYNPTNKVSINLANMIQESFINNLPFSKKEALTGDYYILSCSNIPAVIIECGFLSNKEEELLLLSNDYREKVCYSILCGVIKYLG